jgi:hypothetical protein
VLFNDVVKDVEGGKTMFRLYVKDIKLGDVIMTCITSVDLLEEAELVATMDCRRLFKDLSLHLEYVDDLVYDVYAGNVIVARVMIRSIGEAVSNPTNKR